MDLRAWRKGKGWTQGDVADKISEPRPSFQRWESGINPFPPDVRAKLRKLGYTGPWPRDEAQEATQEAVMPSGLGEELAKLKGRMEALEGQILAALVAAKSLDERVQGLERRAGSSG